MLEFKVPELKMLLWHIKLVEDAYGNEAPCQSTIDNAKHKLLAELEEQTNGRA